MAHFAELNESNIVIRVVVIDNKYVPSDKHADGETWCVNFLMAEHGNKHLIIIILENNLQEKVVLMMQQKINL